MRSTGGLPATCSRRALVISGGASGSAAGATVVAAAAEALELGWAAARTPGMFRFTASRTVALQFSSRCQRLFADLATARGEGWLPRLLAAIERTRLLIIDDWRSEPLTAEQRRDPLEIADDRYDKGSLLIASQVPISHCHEIIGDMTLGDAILDRVVHHAHRLELIGASLRKRRSTTEALAANASE